MNSIHIAIPLICLVTSIITGFFGKQIGKLAAHRITIAGVAIAFFLSGIVYLNVRHGNISHEVLYTWAVSGGIPFKIGFLIDQLSVTMMLIITFVSLIVHIYSIGYMKKDPGYQRFFCYLSLFTFSMLILVMSNNFLQLFFSWEAVGLVSYLLIGFWYQKDTAVIASMKAFLVNRVGDVGFLLGICVVLHLFGSLDYTSVFHNVDLLKNETFISPFGEWNGITVICILLFIGAIGKSAQIPLHIWLPDSMEGPTPISALIHAATMVTAGIFLIARTSPLFELSETALSTILVIGATTAILMGMIGLVKNDIKQVIAYSTLSQLGYMTVALGVSAYEIAIFHLGVHAFFKALLFLSAGSVIIAMCHEQDIRKMGGLRRIMPITYLTSLTASLSLSGIPPLAGFFSKDSIIECVKHSEIWGAKYAYISVLLSIFFTSFYSFRLLFLTFHGKNRSDAQTKISLHESKNIIIIPLILLAVPSFIVGVLCFEPIIRGTFFGESVFILPQHDVVYQLEEHYKGDSSLKLIIASIAHGISTLPFWLSLCGIFSAWYCYSRNVDFPKKIAHTFSPIYRMLDRKYCIDEFYHTIFINGSLLIGRILYKYGDIRLIDGLIVNGLANSIANFSGTIRKIQTGFIYDYAFTLIIGLCFLIFVFAWF